MMGTTTIRRATDESAGLALDYDHTAFPENDYESHPNRVWEKIRKKDAPYGYKSGIDINWPI